MADSSLKSPRSIIAAATAGSTMRIRQAWRSLQAYFVTERYRPEKHYMRGPGPKTLAKRKFEDGRE